MDILMSNTQQFEQLELTFFDHSEEMENLGKHLLLEYKGARTGRVNAADPFENELHGISPKGFTVLMVSKLNLWFRPAFCSQSHGFVMELTTDFGVLKVFSAAPNRWMSPTQGTRNLGWTFIYKYHSNKFASIIETWLNDWNVITRDGLTALAVGNVIDISDGIYLSDLVDQLNCTLYHLRLINQRLLNLTNN